MLYSYLIQFQGVEYVVHFDASIDNFVATPPPGSPEPNAETQSQLFGYARALYVIQKADLPSMLEDAQNAVNIVSGIGLGEVALEILNYVRDAFIAAYIPSTRGNFATRTVDMFADIAGYSSSGSVVSDNILRTELARNAAQILESNLYEISEINPALFFDQTSIQSYTVDQISNAWVKFSSVINQWNIINGILATVQNDASLNWDSVGWATAGGPLVAEYVPGNTGIMIGVVSDLTDIISGAIQGGNSYTLRQQLEALISDAPGLHVGAFNFPSPSLFADFPNSDPSGGVNPPPPPSGPVLSADFVISSMTIDTPAVASGDNVTVSFTVTNVGQGYGGRAALALYMSQDGQASSDDTLLGAAFIPGLASGQSYSGTITRASEALAPDNYFLYVAADSNTRNFSTSFVGDVDESNDGNNASTPQQFTMTAVDGSGNTGPTPPPPSTDNSIEYIAAEIGNTVSTAYVGYEVNDQIASRIDLGGDADWFEVSLEAGETYTISVDGYAGNNQTALNDTFFRIRDENGTPLSPTRNGDNTSYGNANGTLYAELSYTAPASGTYYISIGAGNADLFATFEGGYLFSIFEDGYTPSTGPDLELTSLGSDDYTVDPGDTVRLTFDLENTGNEDADFAEVYFYLSTTQDLSGETYFLDYYRRNSGLEAGEDRGGIVEFRISDDVAADDYYIIGVVDPGDDVVEAGNGETNNVFVDTSRQITVREIDGPDLDIRGGVALSVNEIENGGSLRVSWEAENEGGLEAGSSETHLYLSTDRELDSEDIFLDSDGLPSLDAGERDDEYEDVNIPDHVAAGTYYIIAVLDALDEVVEDDSDNNIKASTVLTISDDVRPDFVIQDAVLDLDSLTPNTIIPGQTAFIDFNIANIGDVEGGRDTRNITYENDDGEYVETFIYLSTDTVLSSDDVFLGSKSPGRMSVQEVNSESIRFSIPDHIEFGDYYILTRADGFGSFPEIYEDNNYGLPIAISYAPGSAGEGADFFIANVEVESTVVSAGERLEVDFEIFNHGTVDADNDYTRSYLTTSETFSLDTVVIDRDDSGSEIDIGEGDRGSETFSLPDDLTPGIYYLHIITNPDQLTPESNYANNSIVPIAITVREALPVFTVGDDTIVLPYGGEYSALDGADFVTGSGDIDFVYGGEGNDTLYGGNGGDALFGEGNNDALIGGLGADYLSGGIGEDTLQGDVGDDILEGGDGTDTAVFNGSISDYSVSENNGIITVIDNVGIDGSDTLTNIERLTFAEGTFISTFGTSANDRLTATTAVDLIYLGNGNDFANASNGDDFIYGGVGGDTIIGGAGADYINGGDGIDQARYANSSGAVFVNLASGTSFGSHAHGDTLVGIENLFGSRFDDRLTGSTGDNTLEGFDGNDILTGSLGDDTLLGGNGDDTFISGPGADFNHGGGGFRDVIDYSLSPEGVEARLGGSQIFNGGHATGDSFQGIEDLIGSAFNDTLVGNIRNNVLSGNRGNDYLSGDRGKDTLLGGDGNDTLIGGLGQDTLDGGDGIDTARYANANSRAVVNLETGEGTAGHSYGDILINIENLFGSNYDDVFIGDAFGNILNGWHGVDRLTGGEGDDTLIGGAGNDRFIFTDGWANDTVTDFEDGADLLDFRSVTGVSGIDDLTIVDYGSGNAVISFGSDSVTLTGIDIADITAADFLF